MSRIDQLTQENERLRERMARLSEASLRVSENLDLEMVLREVVESARVLTGAANAVITTVDRVKGVRDFISSGLTPEERRQLHDLPEGERLWGYLLQSPRPLRVDDLAAHLDGLGFPTAPILRRSFLGAPIRHRGVSVGHFYFTNKEGGQRFTDEDEETLVLFASQAATAIANARVYHEEQRARADLEALIETSPFGVVVLAARSGEIVSINREARRIVADLLSTSGSLQEAQKSMVVRRADGQEVSLAELSLAEALGSAEVVRVEEMVLFVPDGSAVRALVNATPIRGEDGEVASMVVTMQDLAPLEELERQRTEFLSMVGHELRAPLTSIMGSTRTLLSARPELDPAEAREFYRIIDEQAEHMRGLIGDLLDAGRIDAGTLSVAPRPSEVAALVERARSTFLGGGGRHTLLIDLPDDLPPVMADRRRIVQVLNNLLSNAARHSPASVPIQVAAVRDGVHVAISVADQGRGVSPERLPQLFGKHGVGGARGTVRYGLGLAICKGLVEAHGGRIRAESDGAGEGTSLTFTLPVASETADVSRAGRGHATADGHDPPRILVVDDDPRTLRFVRDALRVSGYASAVTGDPREVGRMIRRERPQLVLLDLMFPDTDGIELLEQVPELADLPVIFISGYGRDETIARALEAGAADYIVKPFSPTELVARVRSTLGRSAEATPFVSGELCIRYDTREVSLAGRPLELTATEYGLLRVLSLNAGRVVTRDTLLRQVWGRRARHKSEAVRTFVKKLRRKLGDDAAEPTYIFTKRGVGYRFAARNDS
ncbi:MAG: response regulator [Gemmatimonadetes bacterium]|nr:response regulator [Gemmatimonadota bacterium]MYD13702.1 response regulator [Gemmatimonadota bacterium]MYI66144.1 response regulator [Gemmatimonadota bacterium]